MLETGHTLVLGWSPKLFTVLAELGVANANLPRSVVVVLAPRDKVEMEDEIRARVGDLGRTRVVCRTGDPADLGDLGIVNAAGARAVIVLRPDQEAGDAEVVRAVLGLLKGVPDPALRVVAEFADAQSAETISAASDGRVLTVVSTEIIALITAQVVRQAGLSSVYADLLDFDGDEIYFADAPSLIGQTFADALLAFEESAVIGLRRPDGRIALSPDPTTVLERGDRVIAISSDDDTVVVGAVAVSRGPAPPGPPVVDAAPEHILVLGWNDLGPRVLANLDSHVAPGSTVRVVVDDRYVEPSQVEEVGGLAALRVEVVRRRPVDRAERGPGRGGGGQRSRGHRAQPGSVTRKRVPPASLAAVSVPLCASTIPRVMNRPSPLPGVRDPGARKNLSKRWRSTSSETGPPASATSTTIDSPCRAARSTTGGAP